MKRFVGLVALGISVGASAESLDCRAQVPHSVCGSGNISVVIDLMKNTFESNIGAVACWGEDHQAAGTATQIASVYPYQGSVTYDLVSKRNNEPFARLIVTPDKFRPVANRVAILDVDVSGTLNGALLRSGFNLVCTRILDENEKDDFHCRPGNCNGW